MFITSISYAYEIQLFHLLESSNTPNNILPAILYKKAFGADLDNPAEFLEKRFKQNNWSNAWKDSIYPFNHFHSNTHEVLGVYAGSAHVLIGGEKGKRLELSLGDILILPAGTGHQLLQKSDDFAVVGAYPEGMKWDLFKTKSLKKSELDQAKKNISKVPLPQSDPWTVNDPKGLTLLWSE